MRSDTGATSGVLAWQKKPAAESPHFQEPLLLNDIDSQHRLELCTSPARRLICHSKMLYFCTALPCHDDEPGVKRAHCFTFRTPTTFLTVVMETDRVD